MDIVKCPNEMKKVPKGQECPFKMFNENRSARAWGIGLNCSFNFLDTSADCDFHSMNGISKPTKLKGTTRW
jgi:hypothetical protein